MDTTGMYRRVDSGYVIGAYANDDSKMYARQDGYVYYSRSGNGTWGDLTKSTVVDNEEKLVALLEEAINSPTTKHFGYKPVALFVETFTSVVENESFNSYILEKKRQKALAKLNDEDKEALGLVN